MTATTSKANYEHLLLHLLLNIAKDEPRTDRDWTRVARKPRELRPLANSIERSQDNLERYAERPMDINRSPEPTTFGLDTTKVNRHRYVGDQEHGNMCDREQKKLKQRLNWEIEYTD